MHASSIRLILAAALAWALVGCACSPGSTGATGDGLEAELETASAVAAQPPAKPMPARGTTAQGTVLGHVEFQNHLVTIYSTDAGPRYRLVSDDQGVLADFMDEGQFQERFPALFEAFETAQAARLDATHHADPSPRQPIP